MEFEAVDEGTLGKILVPGRHPGRRRSTQPIALLLEEGEDASALAALTPAAKPAAPRHPPSGRARRRRHRPAATGRRAAAGWRARQLRPASSPLPWPSASPRTPARSSGGARLRSAWPHRQGRRREGPRRRRRQTGRRRRRRPPCRGQAGGGGVPDIGPAFTEVPLSSMRKVIARRLSEAKQTVPHFYLTIDCRVDKLLALRADLNSRSDDTSCRSTTSSSAPWPWPCARCRRPMPPSPRRRSACIPTSISRSRWRPPTG